MKPPCDEAVIDSQLAASPCAGHVGPWVLAATILASSMAFIDSTVVNVALPALQANFGANVVDVQWVIEAYGLTLAALILVGGSMGDLFGRRLMFLLGVALFALASAACGVAGNIHQLIFSRAVQGVGAAFLIPGSLSLISASFDEKERGRAIGTWSGSTAITTAIGPVLGGWLIQHLSWRWAFFINVPLAVVVLVIAFWRVPESRSSHHQRIDWWGALAVTLGLSGVVFGFIESPSLGWRDPAVIASLVVGVAGLLLFVWIEARSQSPMVPLSLFRSRAFSGANLLTLFLYAAIGIFFFLLPLNLIQVQHYSATAGGGAILPMILLMFLLSRWSGGLVSRYGPRLPLTVGPAIVAIGFFLFALPSVGGNYWSAIFPATIVVGFGMAVSVAPLTTVVMESIEQDRAGTASGINNAVARVASLLAIAVLGAIMIAAFGAHLDRAVAGLALPNGVRAAIQSNTTQLAALRVPDGVPPGTSAAIQSSVISSFLYGFRLMMWICAALALASAIVGWQMIQNRTQPVLASSSRDSNLISFGSRTRVE